MKSKGSVILSILIITLGVGWLLTAQRVTPGINWVWTLSLAVLGLIVFVVNGGINKFSIIVGPFFLVCSILSVLRQTEQLSSNLEVPVLVILFGILLLVAHSPSVPFPDWYQPPSTPGNSKN